MAEAIGAAAKALPSFHVTSSQAPACVLLNNTVKTFAFASPKQPWKEKITMTHRTGLRLMIDVNELNGQLRDPDFVIRSTLSVKETYEKMHEVSREVITKAQNMDNAIHRRNCELKEDTILTYMNIALAYAQKIRESENRND